MNILVDDYSDGIAKVCKEVAKCGFIDKTGKVVIELKYDTLSNFKNGVAAVLIGKKWGFMDKNGKIIIPPQYDWTGLVF